MEKSHDILLNFTNNTLKSIHGTWKILGPFMENLLIVHRKTMDFHQFSMLYHGKLMEKNMEKMWFILGKVCNLHEFSMFWQSTFYRSMSMEMLLSSMENRSNTPWKIHHFPWTI